MPNPLSRLLLPILIMSIFSGELKAQAKGNNLVFTVSMKEPASHYFHVSLKCDNLRSDTIRFNMPTWSPGYYQFLHYARNVEHFSVTDETGQAVSFEQTRTGSWLVRKGTAKSIRVSYDVKATTPFVAQSFLDDTHAYLIPASLFIYPDKGIGQSSVIMIEPHAGWPDIATGLEPVPGLQNTYQAENFDILYDSPLLIGKLDSLPAFYVQGIPHRFIGYKIGDFDRTAFVNDLRKIVEGASSIIGDIPYRHYTFLAIGPGRGGIEHLNSTTISFDGSQLKTLEGRKRMLSFITHEYFHHYNVKRIRPVELGPFDYENGSKTRQLWISEGLSVYYEYLVLKRQGMMTQDDFFNALRNNMMAFENKPGKLYQSVAQASYETWSDGPFGRTADEINKTISYYDKGPVLGLLLDLKIRHETKNRRSLDDVMRTLYYDYYKKRNRGFTEDEFRAVCQKITRADLSGFFEYVYTVKDIDYPAYLRYAGLLIDTTASGSARRLAGSQYA
ncbi:MAG: M61 family metallopeptidase [Chitinophagaceae bacterium]|nr:M61 family metallopeptidase [Chitinophagaceae bacterium]